MLPIELQMQIDLAAADLKQDIAERFAKLRQQLTPEPQPDPRSVLVNAQMWMLANSPDPMGAYNRLGMGLGSWGGTAGHYDHYGLGAAWHALLP